MTNSESEPVQRAFELNVSISQEALRSRANIVMEQYVERVLPSLYTMVTRGQGKEDLGSVPNRPEESQLLIDSVGQDMLRNITRDADLPAHILGEHGRQDLAGNSENYVHFAQDPLDNTSQHKRGLPGGIFSVVSSYDQQHNPIGGVVIDIKAKKAYMNINGEASLVYFEIDEPTQTARVLEKETISRSQRETLIDPNATLSTFLGEKEYSLPFLKDFNKLLSVLPRKTFTFAEGGAFIYGLLASGTVDAYVMRNEPRSEIDPGFAIAKLAGCTIVSVDPETGEFEDYNFVPDLNEDVVPLFIAAATSEIRDEIIRYYLEQKIEDETEVKYTSNMKDFIAAHEEEFEIFIADRGIQS